MMNDLETKFAPPKRSTAREINEEAKMLEDFENLNVFTDNIPDIFLILNKNRQIVYANRALEQFLGLASRTEVYGMRPGEAFLCIHSDDMDAGCGTSEFCSECGAAKAILNSLGGVKDVQECSITQKNGGETLDLLVWTNPFYYKGNLFTFFALQDISHEKRRRSLERIFFHDLINTAGSIKGFTDLILENPEDTHQFRDILSGLTNRLISEIESQKVLLAAENNEYRLQTALLDSFQMLRKIRDDISTHNIAREKFIEIDDSAVSLNFTSDYTLLSRVLGNMLKNALEATDKGGTVTLSAFRNGDEIVFSVHNPASMARDVQLQIFKRSFSTKGHDRGLGTYSMKLLTEKYLGGRIYFESNEDAGTTFYAAYPIKEK